MNKLKADTGTMIKILFIEDDLAYAKLVEVLLEESGLMDCELINAPTLKDGLELLKTNDDFSAILLDLTLPDSAGFETLETLTIRYPQKNIIVLTGAKDEALGIKAVQYGAQDYLVKGEFDERQLTKTLRYSIERNNILSRLEEAQRIAKIGHWEYRPEDEFFTASKGVYRIFGIDPSEEAISAKDINSKGNPFYPLFQMVDEAIKRKKVRKESRIRLANNSTRFVSMSCESSLTQEGIYIFSGIIQDITEQKRAEELRKSRDMAQQSSKIKEQIFANVSHEMRTPMNAIQGMANLLFQTELDSEQKQYADSIKESSDVLLAIISDILEISSIQNEKIFFDETEFDLRTVLDNIFETFRPKIENKGLSFKLEVDPKIQWKLKGDKLKLNQVLLNLVGNAAKFTDNGGISLFADVLEDARDFAKIRFRIQDSGIGIPFDKQGLIFEAFTRVLSKGHSAEGTGLGLSIAKKLIERQGGMIGVDSEEGVGSVFYFELTFGKGDTVAESVNVGAEEKNGVKKEQRNFKVLIVEDHKMNQLVMQKTLEKHWGKVEVAVTNNGNEAIAFLEKQAVDIILMDIQMPVRNGFETTDYIRKKMPAEIANIPILAMTAWQYGNTQDDYRKFGFDDFILKPFDPEVLFQKIEYFLDQ
jgi:signal transduction histidine kinase/DNA-binding response OmpR family regulator